MGVHQKSWDNNKVVITCIVVVRHMRVCEEGKQIVLDFENSPFESLKLVIQMCKTFTQEVLHFCLQYLYLPWRDAAVSPDIHGVPYQAEKSP